MRARAHIRNIILACLLWLFGGEAAWAQVAVDLELILAVDISMSMDPDEQRLQREGYVGAFRHPDVIKAIQGGARGRIAVTYIEWAGPHHQAILIPWRLIDGPASAKAFIAELSDKPYSRHTMTSISSALVFASRLFDGGAFRGTRQVIDVSGDGVNNSGPRMSVVRPEVLAQGVVINGLPILVRPTTTWSTWDAPDLDLYYANCVIGGPGAFMIPIRKPEEFVTATRQKLLLEISGIMSGPRVYHAQQNQGEAEYDCAIVERYMHR